jgi:hypothetical protein
MDHLLTTRICADVLKVSRKFIIGEIRDGRLPARVFARPSGRTCYRVEPEAFTAYLHRYWPHLERRSA